MNKKVAVSLFFTGILSLTSCGLLLDNEVNVYLHFDNGEPSETLKVPVGYNVKKLGIPLRENSIFNKWYSDINLMTEFNRAFITEPTHLFAGYNLDVLRVAEIIRTSTLSSVVTIEAYNTPNYFGANTKVAQGSGVIFHEEDNYYYALTNNHVTVKPQDSIYGYNQVIYVLDSDHQMMFLAEKVHELNTYDLAIVRFKSVKDYLVAPFTYDPNYSGRDVIAIGTPQGHFNTVTYGKTLGFGEIDLGEDKYLSDVKFPVLVHDAEIDHGSSGGPLFNYKLEIAGINFASGSSDNKQISVAIQTEKIFEYFDLVGGIFSDIT